MFGRRNRDANASASSGSERANPVGEGPHERSAVADVAGYYADLGYGHMDLGALVIGVPPGRELNVVLDPNGQPEFHILSETARVVPRVYAAPKSAGQWRTWVTDLREQLEQQNAEVTIEDGPWGRELVAELPGAVFRAIGVDGYRWMTEIRVMSVTDRAAAAAEEGREVMRHLLVDRGDSPMPVREPLTVTVPEQVQQALVQAQQQMAAQQQAQAMGQQMGTAAPGAAATAARQPVSGQGMPPAVGGHAVPGSGAEQQAPPPRPDVEPRREGSAMDRLREDDESL